MGIYVCMKSGCPVRGEDFARLIYCYKSVSFYSIKRKRGKCNIIFKYPTGFGTV